MNSINDNEVNRLLIWASENENKNVFLTDNDQEETFWKTKEQQDTYIMEYDFKTIPEFEKFCDFVFQKEVDRKIQRIVSVAAFKHSKDYETDQDKREKAADKLPEHIYVF